MSQNRNTDGEETIFFQTPSNKKRTDQYDTQQLQADVIRRQYQQQNGYAGNDPYAQQNGYAGNGQPYPQQNGYAGNGQPYPQQNGYAGNGQPYPQQNGYDGNGQPYPQQNGYAGNGQPYPQQNGYAGNGQPYPQRTGYAGNRQAASRPAVRNNGSARPASHHTPSNGYHRAGNPQPQRNARPAQAPRNASAPRNGQRSYQNGATPPPPASRNTQHRASAPRARRPRRRRRSLLGRLLTVLFTIVLIIFVLYSALALLGISRMDKVDTKDRAPSATAMDESYVRNILVIGTDSRDLSEECGRSDSMILLSMNSKSNTFTITSFLRDAYVEIPGNGWDRLNAAYSYGGAELLMDTIESNFQVSVDDYVLFTFAACSDLIQAAGGVDLDLSDEEVEWVNGILSVELNELLGDDANDDLLEFGKGSYHLDGKQALAYSRIRKVPTVVDGIPYADDFGRAQRQRVVMTQVMQNVLKNPTRLGAVLTSALPNVCTNMHTGGLYWLSLKAPFMLLTYDKTQQQIPYQDEIQSTFQGSNIDGQDVLEITDFAANQQRLKETIYGK